MSPLSIEARLVDAIMTGDVRRMGVLAVELTANHQPDRLGLLTERMIRELQLRLREQVSGRKALDTALQQILNARKAKP